jgi:hypothetical protein
MTAGAILSLTALNLWLLVVGLGVLFGLRGWTSWGEPARLAGLAYMLGLATSGLVWVWQLVVGIDMSVFTVLVTGVLLGLGGVGVGLARGYRFPRLPRPAVPAPPSVLAAIGAGVTTVYLLGLFRSGRLAGLYEFDAWAFWVPKAMAISFFGGLDEQFFRELPGQSYPPLVPALESASFSFMGSTDAVTLHLQLWFITVGFVAAVVGLLSRRVAPLLLWPPFVLLLVTPHFVVYALQPQADFLLDEFFALAVLLVALWIVDGELWQLAGAAILTAAAMSTKREGYVLALCLLLAALLVARRSWRLLLLAGAFAALTTVPWRVFLAARDLSGGGPEAGGTGLLSNFDRAWPSLRLALSTVFDFNIWLIVLPLLLVALTIGFTAEDRRLPTFVSVFVLLCVAALTWSTWAFPSLPVTKEAALNPIVRFSGALIVSAAVLIPLLLVRPWFPEPAKR